MYWSGVLALVGWAATAVAQGNLGGDQTASCPAPTNDWQYVGCYDDGQNGGKANFPFRVEYNNPSAPKSYPGLTTQSQLSVDSCLQACRGHGLEYGGIYNGQECYCSSLLPYPIPPSSGSTAGYTTFSYYGSNPGRTVSNSQCNVPCPANSAQTCGGPGFLQVYRDPSFALETNPPSIGAAGNFQYFGCYNGANNGPISLDIKTPSTVSCQTYCGRLGFAYAIRNADDYNLGNNCGCGPELQGGYQIAETDCNRFCNGTNGAAGGVGSCGGNNAFSVYFNTLLDGCYLVRQPGGSTTTTYVAPPNAGRVCNDPSCFGTEYTSSAAPTVTSTTSSPRSTLTQVQDINDVYQLSNVQLYQLLELTSCVRNDRLSDCVPDNKLLHNPDSYHFRRLVLGSLLYHHFYNCTDTDHNRKPLHAVVHQVLKIAGTDDTSVYCYDKLHDNSAYNDHYDGIDHHNHNVAVHNHFAFDNNDNESHNDNDHFHIDNHNHHTDYHHNYLAFNDNDHFPIDDHYHYTNHHHDDLAFDDDNYPADHHHHHFAVTYNDHYYRNQQH
ncbi:MAG: hypothetical protein Q9197_006808 [Variospora fuerteventurae]